MKLGITAQSITQHIESIYRNTVYNDNELSQAITENVFFATMKFDGAELNSSRSSPSAYLDQYGEWYHRLMQDSFGKHLGRKRRLQPLSYAFVDIPGSRYRNSYAIDQQVATPLHDQTQYRGPTEYLNSGWLHIHAVIALVPGPGQACRWRMLASTSIQRTRELGQMEISQFNPSRGSLVNLVAYSMKGAVQLGSMIKDDCWGLFPR